MALCKFCGRDAPLVKAHVVPEAFYREMKAEDKSMLWMLGADESEHVRRSPIGEYDQQLVCKCCERRFQPYDQYAADLLIRDRDLAFKRHATADGTDYWVCGSFDYRRLKLFLISVLWRASASERAFFHRVSLGPYENSAADLIRTEDPGQPTQFQAIFSRWTVKPRMEMLPKFMANPFGGRLFDGVRTVRIYLAAFAVDVSIEKRPIPPPLGDATLHPSRPLMVFGRDLHGSRDLAAFADVLMSERPPGR